MDPYQKGAATHGKQCFFNVDELFISVGIDVGADFSRMSIVLPNQQFVGKPYKILHSRWFISFPKVPFLF